MRRLLLAFFLLSFLSGLAQLDCPEGQHTFSVVIQPDSWPYEMSWVLSDADGNVLLDADVTGAEDTLFTFCIEPGDWDPCMTFSMNDSYGDGLVGDAFYQAWLDGEMLVEGSGNYGFGQAHSIDCPPGWTCDEAIELVMVEGPVTLTA